MISLFEAARPRLAWPGPNSAETFANQLLGLVINMRSPAAPGDLVYFRGGASTMAKAKPAGSPGEDADDGEGYNTKSFVRDFLLAAEAEGMLRGGTFDALPGKALLRWCPDTQGNLQPVSGLSVGALRAAFGVSPLLVSSYACDAAAVSDADRTAWLKKSDAEYWDVAQNWCIQQADDPDEHDRWPPRLRDFFSRV